jgi:hypothetical protein
MKSVLITSARSIGDIGITLAKWAGVSAIALSTIAGCSVNVSRPGEEFPWATPRSERASLFWRTDSPGFLRTDSPGFLRTDSPGHPGSADNFESRVPATDDLQGEMIIDQFSGEPRPPKLRPLVVAADVGETRDDAEAPEHGRLIEAQTVKRLGDLAAYYGALLRLPNEPMFWRGVTQSDTDRRQSGLAQQAEGAATPKQHMGAMPPMGGSTLSASDLQAVSAYDWAIDHPVP